MAAKVEVLLAFGPSLVCWSALGSGTIAGAAGRSAEVTALWGKKVLERGEIIGWGSGIKQVSVGWNLRYTLKHVGAGIQVVTVRVTQVSIPMQPS
jgi:hypothetical protein